MTSATDQNRRNHYSIWHRLEQFIARGLNHRYNPRAARPATIIESHAPVYPDQLNHILPNIELFINNTGKSSGLMDSYRLPQTRIRYYKADFETFSVAVLDYLDFSLIMLSNFHLTDPLEISVQKKNACKLHVSSTGGRKKGAQLDIAPAEEISFLVDKNNVYTDWDHFLTELEDIYALELENHPLDRLILQEAEVLGTIDELWASLNYIGPGNELRESVLAQSDLSDLIWIQELYIILGWYDPLRNVYQKLRDRLPNDQDSYFLKLAGQRFRQIDPVHPVINELPVDRSKDAGGFIPEDTWLYRYLFDIRGRQENIIKLQEHWEKWHFPVLDAAIAREIRRNPDEWIALVLCAIDGHFWWYKTVYEKVRLALQGDKRNLFELLVAVKSVVNVTIQPGFKICSKLGEIRFPSGIRHLSEGSKIEYNRHGNTLFTFFEEDGLRFKINKQVTFQYESKNQRLSVSATIYKPPIELPQFREIKIIIDEYVIFLPLIWDNFEIHCNDNRFRFLRKKNRFQVSLKLSPHLKVFQLDEIKLSPKEAKYHKKYINLQRTESESNLELYNIYGVPVHKRGKSSVPVIWRGIGRNTFGCIVEQYRLGHENSKKTISLDTNRLSTPLRPVARETPVTKFMARYCDPQIFSVSYNNSKADSYLYADYERFRAHSVVYTVGHDKEIVSKLGALFWQLFSFYPRFADISRLELNHRDYVFLVDPDDDVNTLSFGPIRRESGIKAIQIPAGKLEELHNIFSVL